MLSCRKFPSTLHPIFTVQRQPCHLSPRDINLLSLPLDPSSYHILTSPISPLCFPVVVADSGPECCCNQKFGAYNKHSILPDPGELHHVFLNREPYHSLLPKDDGSASAGVRDCFCYTLVLMKMLQLDPRTQFTKS